MWLFGPYVVLQISYPKLRSFEQVSGTEFIHPQLLLFELLQLMIMPLSEVLVLSPKASGLLHTAASTALYMT